MFSKRKIQVLNDKQMSKKQKLTRILYIEIAILLSLIVVVWSHSFDLMVKGATPEIQQRVVNEVPKVKSIYEQISDITGGENVDVLYNLAKCESDLKIYAVGINNDKVNSYDRGFYQINSYWHSEVPDHCAFDLECSTIWANNMIKSGQLNQWVCINKI